MSWWLTTRDASVGLAVYQLVADGGVDCVSMRAIARTGRMAHGTLGHHYRSKRQLLAVAAREIGDRHLQDLVSRAAVGGTGTDRLAELVARNEPELTEMRVWYDLVAVGRSLPEVGAVTSALDDRFRGFLVWCLKDPLTDEPPLPAIVDQVWLLVQAVRLEQVRPGSLLTVEQAMDRCRTLRVARPAGPMDPAGPIRS